MTYKEQIKDPRWKAVRLIIIRRDRGRCIRCSSRYGLVVHHKRYINGLMAWEHPPELLETLCNNCHMEEHEIYSSSYYNHKDRKGLKRINGIESINIPVTWLPDPLYK